MPGLALVDHSPHQPVPAAKLSTAENLVLIDNYDSFTWNVYQYLVLEGATVTVYRNDKVTLEELIATHPTQLVISPGPGHPDTDAGVSKDAIKYFAGRIPVFGVCMGQQCIISVFGGKVDVTGEILHGKTSPLRHDGGGVYAGLSQDLPVTRYHSLAGTHPTLPASLEISSWISQGPDGGKGVIMGVRHKEYVVEGVQFHPESILTENGRLMFKNFLTMTGGKWSQNPHFRAAESDKAEPRTNGHVSPKQQSILDKIYAHRRTAVEAQRLLPSQRLEDLQASYILGLAPPQISFPKRLRQSAYPLSLMAEIKRASPSKGIIALSACAPAQARKYATAGASVISVLTEPEWFKGSIDDLRAVRQSLESMPNRPAVLRKEFIFDEYQILEARLAGADTVLLIVKMLEVATLARLYKYSQSLGMEPLVEVNTAEEMKIAIELGSQVIGVNNRNLMNFEVDLGTTSRLMDGVPSSTVVCALSGISGPEDVVAYSRDGVKAVLVGEALMRASDTTEFIARLLGDPEQLTVSSHSRLSVKICGTRTPEGAKAAIDAGADSVGIILVPGTKRYVEDAVALRISEVVKNTPRPTRRTPDASPSGAYDFFDHSARTLLRPDRAQLVGVFMDATLEHIIDRVQKLSLDVVQLHGSEPLEYARNIPVPVVRKFAPRDIGISIRGYHDLPLLDAGAGSGKQLDVEELKSLFKQDQDLRVILAGGLTPENVSQILNNLGPYLVNVAGVDVSSGVEVDGKQDASKIAAFVTAVKG